jgi:hypothetical protein
MNQSLRENKSILKFIETNRLSLKNLKLNGENLSTHRSTLAPTPSLKPAIKFLPPMNQNHTMSVRQSSINKVKDLRDKRLEMAMKICELIEEINSAKFQSKSNAKVLSTIINSLMSCFEPHEGFDKIFKFLKNELVGNCSDFEPAVRKYFTSVNFEVPETFSFKELWTKYSNQCENLNQTENYNLAKEYKKELKAKRLEIKEMMREKAELQSESSFYKISVKNLNSMRKEKYDLVKELLECKFDLVNKKDLVEKLKKENNLLKITEEKISISEKESILKTNEMYRNLTEVEEKLRRMEIKAKSRKIVIAKLEDGRRETLADFQATNEIIDMLSKTLKSRINELSKSNLRTTLDSPIRNIQLSVGYKKPSRFSTRSKNRKSDFEDSGLNKKVQMLKPSNTSNFNTEVGKKSSEDISVNEAEHKTDVWKSIYNSSINNFDKISTSTDLVLVDFRSFLSKCVISSSLAHGISDILVIIKSNLLKTSKELANFRASKLDLLEESVKF